MTADVIGFLKKVEKHLPELNEELAYTINSGGCGVFAEYCYQVLCENGFKPEILVCSNSWEIETVKDAICNNTIAEVGKDHIVIKVQDEMYFDSTGLFSESKLRSRWGSKRVPVPLPLLKKWNRTSYWNDVFPRHAGKKAIKQFFKQIKP